MSITDELRKFTPEINGYKLMRPCDEKELLAIADRIDTALAERYVELPKDADGEVIHVGDELYDEWHEQNQGEVEWLMLNHHGWWLKFKDDCERFYLHEFHEWHHHHAPTVEDTLHELIGKALMLSEVDGENELVAEYAKRLTLRGDGE